MNESSGSNKGIALGAGIGYTECGCVSPLKLANGGVAIVCDCASPLKLANGGVASTLRVRRETKILRYGGQAPIARPEFRAGAEPYGCQQMSIDETQAGAERSLGLDQLTHLGMSRNGSSRQIVEEREHDSAITQGSERQLADDHGMHVNLGVLEQGDQTGVSVVQMIDPDRRVDQDHAGCR
jgi:hypothetical protein